MKTRNCKKDEKIWRLYEWYYNNEKQRICKLREYDSDLITREEALSRGVAPYQIKVTFEKDGCFEGTILADNYINARSELENYIFWNILDKEVVQKFYTDENGKITSAGFVLKLRRGY